MDLRHRAVDRGVLAWVGAWAFALTLSWLRYRSAMSSTSRPDLEDFFLPAARAVRAGDSPFEVLGYPPLIAVILAPIAEAPWAATAWTLLLVSLALLSCWVGARACADGLGQVGRALVFALAAGSLLTSWGVSVELWQGQVQLFVLAALSVAMLATVRRVRGVAGAALAFAGAVKTWPALLLIWLLRRPLRPRRAEWVGALTVALATVALVMAVGGPSALGALGEATLRASRQPLVAYSAWGTGSVLFSDSGLSEPLVVSSVLSAVVTGLLLLWVLVLLLLTLRRPGDPVVALLNVAFCVVLVLPVCHYVYLLVPLPALWWWAARALREPRRWEGWVAPVVLALWWYLALRRIPVGPDAETTPASFTLILGSTLVAATVSVWMATRLSDAAPLSPAGATPTGATASGTAR